MNGRRQLEQSYKDHPNFRFAPPWHLDRGLAQAFNRAHAELEADAPRLSRSAFAKRRRAILDLLDAVFAALAPQATAADEAQFLAELKAESMRLLLEEVVHFRAVRARPEGRAKDPLVEKLQSQRHFFGRLSSDGVQDILAIAAPHLARFRERAAAGRLQRDDLSLNEGRDIERIKKVLNREFARQGVLRATGNYVGRRVRVTGVSLELSVPQSQWWVSSYAGLPRPPATLYAHLDETISMPKAIVYLSDVTPANGPTSCYPGAYEALGPSPLEQVVGRVLGHVGNRADTELAALYKKRYHQSMASEPFRRHFMRLPPEMRFNSHLGWDILPGSGAEDLFLSRETAMLGPKGTFIAFDGGRLLHRGGLIQDGERIALQVILSELPPHRYLLARLREALP